MDPTRIEALLREVHAGTLSLEGALERLSGRGVRDLGHTRLDLERETRCGAPEVVFGGGKTPSELVDVSVALAEEHGRLLVTRASPEGAAALVAAVPGAVHHERSGVVVLSPADAGPGEGSVVVASAGTSDGAVAEEAAMTARWLGARVETFPDVGVSGLHRLLACVDALRAANAIVVVAGMEGALPSVVGGLVDRPVIAVPTSVGYGASLGGLAALFAMLNTCASGVTVCNIDNGFGAGFSAARINRLVAAASKGRTAQP